jgi:hypothetical protein
MRKLSVFLLVLLGAVCVYYFSGDQGVTAATTSPEWSMNATAIEACSCPMFCPCYFNKEPAGHHDHGTGGEEHYCRANLAYKINKGKYGSVNLDGAKFWIVSDLGADFSKGQMDWAVVYFDKPLTKDQREGIGAIVGNLFPVQWKSLTTAEADIDTWEFNKDTAHATMDGGKTAEVKLIQPPHKNTNDAVVIKNLKYWGAPRNDGFVLMPNEVEAYRVGPKAFEFKGTNGFMITVDINSKDIKPAPAKTTR